MPFLFQRAPPVVEDLSPSYREIASALLVDGIAYVREARTRIVDAAMLLVVLGLVGYSLVVGVSARKEAEARQAELPGEPLEAPADQPRTIPFSVSDDMSEITKLTQELTLADSAGEEEEEGSVSSEEYDEIDDDQSVEETYQDFLQKMARDEATPEEKAAPGDEAPDPRAPSASSDGAVAEESQAPVVDEDPLPVIDEAPPSLAGRTNKRRSYSIKKRLSARFSLARRGSPRKASGAAR